MAGARSKARMARSFSTSRFLCFMAAGLYQGSGPVREGVADTGSSSTADAGSERFPRASLLSSAFKSMQSRAADDGATRSGVGCATLNSEVAASSQAFAFRVPRVA